MKSPTLTAPSVPITVGPREPDGLSDVERLVPQAPPLDPRVVAWQASDLVSRRCPVCDGDRYRPIVRRPDGLLVVRCTTCDLHYLPEVPSNDALTAFYARYSASHQRWQSTKTRSAALKAAGRRRNGNGLLAEIAKRRRLSGRKLLELGCSSGSFLLDAREAGAVVSGMELDVGARDFVAGFGIPCHATLESALDAGPYDIVVALNLIEHLPRPKQWLESIAGALVPGGLVVIWTPNGGQADTFGAGWVGFRVDLDHLTYFSHKTLSSLLVGAGLWPEAAWELSQASLSGFREVEPAAGRVRRLMNLFRREPSKAWSLPTGVGGFTLGVFAGKA